MSEVRLTVNRIEYGGWKSMRLVRGIEQIAGTFELGVSELWPDQKMPREIAPNDECTVTVDGTVAITGYVDDVKVGYSGKQHEVTIAGRDASGDLVDCSAVYRAGKWTGRKMESIASDLCAPFKVAVKAEVDTGGAVADWNIQEGETVFECLERLARLRGALLVSDGRGGIVITRSGKGGRVGVSLERGENILEGAVELSFRDRFSAYTAKGQVAGNDATWGNATRLKATASDAMVRRHRPLVVIAEDQADGATLKRRALWEANVRAGKSAQLTIKVQGWSYQDGGARRLWQPNTLVHLRDPWLRCDADLLIKQVTFTLDDGGSIAELALTLPQAFDLIPMLPKGATKPDAWDMLGKQQRDIDELRRQQERAKK